MKPIDVWAALAALLVAAILATLASLLERLPAEVEGAFFGGATVLVTFALGAFMRPKLEGAGKVSDDDDGD